MIFSLALIKPSLYIIGPTERTEPLAKVLSPGGRHIHLHKSFVLLSARGQVRTTSSSSARPLGRSKGSLSRRQRGLPDHLFNEIAQIFTLISHLRRIFRLCWFYKAYVLNQDLTFLREVRQLSLSVKLFGKWLLIPPIRQSRSQDISRGEIHRYHKIKRISNV